MIDIKRQSLEFEFSLQHCFPYTVDICATLSSHTALLVLHLLFSIASWRAWHIVSSQQAWGLWVNGWMSERVDRWAGGWVSSYMIGWMGGWIDG